MSQGQTRITVQVQPNARQNEVVGFEGGVLQVRVAAPPVKGRANRELIEFLSRLFAVRKSNITIEKGMTSRRKTLAINGLSEDEIAQRLGC